ncbi:hypothetical protein QJS10_CPA06g00555 [Acorus calamus]|uniref:WRKY19-like zinc finger domain-containing protein n=1 Tax=Acorus calamus TaxID=4465 RepID=A0AAV9ENJ8_ACOCL|nr:hypothetical protein QJS10_CPA06g00555 [Acorus calamus]
MDLNVTTLYYSGDAGYALNCGQSDNLGDTALGLNCLGHPINKSARTSDSQSNHNEFLSPQDDGCRLVLGLGPTPNLYLRDSMGGPKKNKGSHFASDSESRMLKLGLSRDTMEEENIDSTSQPQPSNEDSAVVPVFDEGSTSARRMSGGYMPSLLLAPRHHEACTFSEFITTNNVHHLQLSPDPSATTEDCSIGTISDSTIAGGAAMPCRSGGHHPRKCRFNGCSKGARGASGLCIAHGGGQRCQKLGCNKGAESRTAYCKAHGGGHRCQYLGCTKSAEGKTDFCIAHGGGRRCSFPGGCTKAARGKSGLCIRHGGGKRCTVEGCSRSAEGQAGLCISHGGGRRCQYSGCSKGAQGSTNHCKAHGGGKRCIFAGCNKGAEGSTPLCKGHGGGKRCLFEGGGVCPKSVHGGTDYCVAHGGGKRCAVPGCTKSARGRTDCCVRHGGGKRCHFEGCKKSAQGSTDFCKAHGGGKRCSWISPAGGCEKFARGKSGLCAAHLSLAFAHDRSSGGGMIGPGLFCGLVSGSTMVARSADNDYSSSGVSAVSDCVESQQQQQQLIPHQVLVPLSMKSSSLSSGIERDGTGGSGTCIAIPEGRVHGGGLMSLLGGSLRNAVDGI